MVSDKLIKEFQEIYKGETGKEISLEEARRLGTYLVEYFQLLIKMKEDGE